MAELATAAIWLLAEFAHRANSDRSALPSGHKDELVYIVNIPFKKRTLPVAKDGGIDHHCNLAPCGICPPGKF
jgi:hypothetical protein